VKREKHTTANYGPEGENPRVDCDGSALAVLLSEIPGLKYLVLNQWLSRPRSLSHQKSSLPPNSCIRLTVRFLPVDTIGLYVSEPGAYGSNLMARQP